MYCTSLHACTVQYVPFLALYAVKAHHSRHAIIWYTEVVRARPQFDWGIFKPEAFRIELFVYNPMFLLNIHLPSNMSKTASSTACSKICGCRFQNCVAALQFCFSQITGFPSIMFTSRAGMFFHGPLQQVNSVL